jgi:hypothetical protein
MRPPASNSATPIYLWCLFGNSVYYSTMKLGAKAVWLAAWCISIMGAATTSSGAVGENPYEAIVERNVFDLKPPPPPKPVDTTTNAPPPNVKLTGITSILGNKRALFMVSEAAPGGKGAAGKEVSYILREGERKDSIEVLEISEKPAQVKIRNDGVESMLVLDTNPKLPGGGGEPGGPGGGRGGPGGHRGLASAPGMPAPAMPGFNGGGKVFGGRGGAPNPMGAMSGGSGMGAMANGAGMGSAYDNGMTTLPTRTMRTGVDPMQMLMQPGQQPVEPTQPAQQNLSLEEAAILTAAEAQSKAALTETGLYPPVPDIMGLKNQPGAQGPGQNEAGLSLPGLLPGHK